MTLTNWLALAAVVGLTMFSILALALRAPSRARMTELFEAQDRPEALERFLARRGQYLLAAGVFRSAAILLLFVVVLHGFEARAGDEGLAQIVLGSLAAWGFLVVFGVAIPHAWTKYSSEALIVGLIPLLEVLRIACFPIVLVVELCDPVVRRLVGAPPEDARTHADELEQGILDAVTEGELHGAVDEQEKEMIESVIELGDKRAAEIMTPRTEIVALPADAELAAVLDSIRLQGHSRIPVYDGTIDTILGVLYAKDLLGRSDDRPFSLRALMRKAMFIPESKPVVDLLREFQREKVHLAIVLDEYGGTAGLITIEDILEELVGEIADEYEPAEPATLRQVDEHTYEVDARMRIDDLNNQLEIGLPDDADYETIGGFVFSTLGKIPKAGESCAYENLGIEVLAAEPRRVTRLLLRVSPTEDAERAVGENL